MLKKWEEKKLAMSTIVKIQIAQATKDWSQDEKRKKQKSRKNELKKRLEIGSQPK